jgi:hypothetical protein
VAQDEALGPVLLSVKHEMLAGQDYVRLILRLQTGTLHEVVPATCLSDQASPHRMAKVSPSIFPFSFSHLFLFSFPSCFYDLSLSFSLYVSCVCPDNFVLIGKTAN